MSGWDEMLTLGTLLSADADEILCSQRRSLLELTELIVSQGSSVSGCCASFKASVSCLACTDVDDAADDSVEEHTHTSEQHDTWELEASEKSTSPSLSVSMASPWKRMKSPVRVYWSACKYESRPAR